MITVKQTRDRGTETYDLGTSDKTVMGSLKLLLDCELKFGADVTDLGKTSLTVVTRVLDCIDTTVFSGDEVAMKWLIDTASAYSVLKAQLFKPEVRDVMVERVMRMTGGLPILMQLGTGMIVGTPTTQAAVVAVLVQEDPALIDKISDKSYSELMTMLEWKVVDKMSLYDIVALAA